MIYIIITCNLGIHYFFLIVSMVVLTSNVIRSSLWLVVMEDGDVTRDPFFIIDNDIFRRQQFLGDQMILFFWSDLM